MKSIKPANSLIYIGFAVLCLSELFTSCTSGPETTENDSENRPNIIYILADDLGYADLGCYGQKYISTPNLDRMASEGMKFTQHYSGSTVCAPSRSCLLTGLHTGRTYIRGNNEVYPEGQVPIDAEAYTIAELMKDAGYVTAAFGKWGLGMNETEGSPVRQGFDYFLGFLCQRYAHRYYHQYLWENEDTLFMEGNDFTKKTTYVPDYLHEKTLDFIKENKDTSFFLFIPSVIPHAELIAPDDSLLKKYKGKFEETPWGIVSDNPYRGNDYGADNFIIEGYAPVNEPRTTIAAMISRLDLQVGEILTLLRELGIDDNTIVMFTSDNGPHTEGGADPEFFGSNGPFTGTKRDLYEGGIRVPMIAWWPGHIGAGETSDYVSGFWDVMPTFADIAGMDLEVPTDGISLLPVFQGSEKVEKHDVMYWEFYERGGRIALRKDDWKLVCYNIFEPETRRIELYDLSKDIAEENDLSQQHPEKLKELILLVDSVHVPNDNYSLTKEIKDLKASVFQE